VWPCRASFYLTHLQQAAQHVHDLSAAKAAESDQDHTTAPAATASDGLYAPYLLECIERDGSQTVGLGLPMWLLVLAFVLLSGAIVLTDLHTLLLPSRISNSNRVKVCRIRVVYMCACRTT
jgi:hypothetical protein